jgi:hypothetical protein
VVRVFGIFSKGPQLVGTYSMKVLVATGTEVCVAYDGDWLPKDHSLLLRGLYAAKSMYTASDNEVSAYVLSAIAKGCICLDEDDSSEVTSAAGVTVVPEGRTLTGRYREHIVDVVRERKTAAVPMIQTRLPGDGTAGDLIATVAAFNQSWLSENRVEPGTLAAKSFLQFFSGFLRACSH